MKQLQKSELIKGEIYTSKSTINPNNLFIWMCSDNNELKYTSRLYISNINAENGLLSLNRLSHSWRNIFESTPEEKYWLETCIKLDKFVSYEEAMGTFIPEYVECINNVNVYDYGIIGRIYKFNNLSEPYWGVKCNLKCGIYEQGSILYFNKYQLKPSTKEAYDAQFVVEEPKDKLLQVNQIRGKGTTIVKVESSEGGIFQIGDKITPFDKDSPNKGKPFTITGFRWNNAKTEICAITNGHLNVGIRLSKIELYIEPKKELSLLEQAKLRYPIGTNYFTASLDLFNAYYSVTYQAFTEVGKDIIYANPGQGCLYYKGKWAEIVEDFVLPEKWCVKITENNINVLKSYYIEQNYRSIGFTGWMLSDCGYDGTGVNWYRGYDHIRGNNKLLEYTEITLEQFKKYVLKDE